MIEGWCPTEFLTWLIIYPVGIVFSLMTVGLIVGWAYLLFKRKKK